METTHTRTVKYTRETGDFEITVNGEVIGYAPTKLRGEEIANAHVYRILTHPIATVSDEAPVACAMPAPAAVALDAETLFLVQEEAAAGCPEAIAQLAAITRDTVAHAAQEARVRALSTPRWLNAIDKAAQQLEGNAWAWYAAHEVLRIASATNPAIAHRATATTCDCPAHAFGRPCFHIAAARLLRNAQRAS